MNDNQAEYLAPEPEGYTPQIPSWVYGKRGLSPGDETTGSVRPHPWKRPFDIAVGLIGLLVAAPMWLIFALAIKLEDRGPILFTQDRWGKDQTIIRVFKFRSMVPNALERFGNIQAQEHDPRVTRIGRFLRATSLDEMPQLLNIVRGDMSWVGPRALPINEVQTQGEDSEVPDEDIPGFAARSRIRPGLTGIAQIFAPRDIPRAEKYAFDAVYATTQSLWLDLRLITVSVWITLRARWEARDSKL